MVHRGERALACVFLGGAGDRDRTGMTSLEDRWRHPPVTCRNGGPGQQLASPVMSDREYPSITVTCGTYVARGGRGQIDGRPTRTGESVSDRRAEAVRQHEGVHV